MRIGLYGGSFDPVHLGHLLVAQAAFEELALDKVVFIPASQSPFKPGRSMLAGGLRSRLLRLALAGRPSFQVDAQELDRGGISYSIDTVRDYEMRYPHSSLFYLIGEDHVSQLPKWRESALLAQKVEFLIIPRPGAAHNTGPAGFKTKRLGGFPMAVSSSEIRERIKRGLPVDLLTGSAVAEAINNNKLYFSEK